MSCGIQEQLSKQKESQLWIGVLGLRWLCLLLALSDAFPIALFYLSAEGQGWAVIACKGVSLWMAAGILQVPAEAI